MSNVGKRLAGGPAPRPPRRGRLTRQHIVLIVIIVILAVALLATLAFRSLFVRPELPARNDPKDMVDADGDGRPDDPNAIDYGEGIRPRGSDGERKSKDYWTVLILGRDTGGGGNTDTILLASYDVTGQKATIMSIPRDTMVNIPYDIKKINAVYNYYGQGEKGIQHLYKEIAQLVGFEPDFQVVVEWDAVGEIVDAIGGVWFDVPLDMNYEDPYQDLSIHQAKGYRLLSGDDAMQVLRYRYDNDKKHGYAEGDVGRIKTQQAFLKAMAEQVLQPKNMTKAGPLIEAFNNNVETDLSFQNILWFGKSAVMGGLKIEDVNFVTMPHTTKNAYSRSVERDTHGRQREVNYVLPKPKALLDLVNDELSPFTEVFTLKDLDIMSVNADGSLSSSTGYVEDKPSALPPPSPETEEEDGTAEDPEGGTAAEPDPEAGGPIVVEPGDGGGGAGTGTADPGWTTIPGDPGTGTAVPGDPGAGTAAPPSQGDVPPGGGADPGTPEPVPETPPAPSEPVPAEPQPPSDPGFALIGPDPAA
nr:LCP family protein [uncultured Oscillibacter sp.]